MGMPREGKLKESRACLCPGYSCQDCSPQPIRRGRKAHCRREEARESVTGFWPVTPWASKPQAGVSSEDHPERVQSCGRLVIQSSFSNVWSRGCWWVTPRLDGLGGCSLLPWKAGRGSARLPEPGDDQGRAQRCWTSPPLGHRQSGAERAWVIVKARDECARKPPGDKEEWGRGLRGKHRQGVEGEGEVGCLLKTQQFLLPGPVVSSPGLWPRACGGFSGLRPSPEGLCGPFWMGGGIEGWVDVYPTFSDQVNSTILLSFLLWGTPHRIRNKSVNRIFILLSYESWPVSDRCQ